MAHTYQKRIARVHKEHWADHAYAASVIFGLALFVASLFSAYLANKYLQYANNRSVPDLLLDVLPNFDVTTPLLIGIIIFFMYLFFLCAARPKLIPFTLKTLSLLILVRSVFVILTHLGAPTTYFDYHNPITKGFFPLLLDDGFFFSGHVAVPFLLALSFWKDRISRLLFFLISLIAAVLVLVGRLHYSIDVFAAYFVAWGIFSIAKIMFQSDYRRVLAVEK